MEGAVSRDYKRGYVMNVRKMFFAAVSMTKAMTAFAVCAYGHEASFKVSSRNLLQAAPIKILWCQSRNFLVAILHSYRTQSQFSAFIYISP